MDSFVMKRWNANSSWVAEIFTKYVLKVIYLNQTYQLVSWTVCLCVLIEICIKLIFLDVALINKRIVNVSCVFDMMLNSSILSI